MTLCLHMDVNDEPQQIELIRTYLLAVVFQLIGTHTHTHIHRHQLAEIENGIALTDHLVLVDH